MNSTDQFIWHEVFPDTELARAFLAHFTALGRLAPSVGDLMRIVDPN